MHIKCREPQRMLALWWTSQHKSITNSTGKYDWILQQ